MTGGMSSVDPMAMPSHAKGVAIVGGGRWARVIASVLGDLLPAGSQVKLCSPGNPDGWRAFVSARDGGAISWSYAATLSDIWTDDRTTHVIIARAARNHAVTAIAALHAGKATLVEKPFALTAKEAQAVVEAAKDRVCVTGLVLLFAVNLRRFASAARSLGPPHTIDVVWTDSPAENRHGETKNYDASISVVEDVMPHVWSLLQLVVPGALISPVRVVTGGGGRIVEAFMQVPGAKVRVKMGRDEPKRIRQLHLASPAGDAFIDFSQEPGVAQIAGRAIDVAEGFTSPLARQLREFLDLSVQQCIVAPQGVVAAYSSIELAEAVMSEVRSAQMALIDCGQSIGADPASIAYARRELDAIAFR